MKKIILVLMTAMLVVLMMSMGSGAVLAQTATATPSGSTEFNSSVTIFGVICENQAVVNLNGTMEPAYDVYYQVFSGAQGGGTALTNLRRVQVDGVYAFSEAVPFSGPTVATGAAGSVKVYIAPESAPNSPAGDIFVVDDVQDGCGNAQNPVSSSIDTGAGASSTTGTTTSTAGLIRSPFGGYINSSVPVVPEGEVVIGARQFVNPQRSSTPGVIFAECDSYLPAAAPGVLYDNDNITIFFSWYAKTEAQVLDHLAKAQYSVLFQRAPLVDLATSAITKIGSNYWVFFTANIGNLKPGQYGVEYKLTWSDVTFDGYDDYGPGTNNVELGSTCSFTIERNPDDAPVVYNNIYSVR